MKQGHDFYVDDGLWDTFRSLHPLHLLIEPDRQQDMVRFYIRMLRFGEAETDPEVTHEKRQAVSVTLETAYDDWAVRQLAQALGHTADAKYFHTLAENYRNVFNPAIGFMAPKSEDGRWWSRSILSWAVVRVAVITSRKWTLGSTPLMFNAIQ